MANIMQKSHTGYFVRIVKITISLATAISVMVLAYVLYERHEQRECYRNYDQTLETLKSRYFDPVKLEPLFAPRGSSTLPSGDVNIRPGASGTAQLFAEHLLPFLMKDSKILDYPKLSDAPPPCSQTGNHECRIDRGPLGTILSDVVQVPPRIKTRYKDIIDIGKSVGQLTLMGERPRLSTDTDLTRVKYFWGTAFMIADGIVATSCHTIEPLMKKNERGEWVLKPDNELKLNIAFSDFNYPGPHSLKFKACSGREGMDIALLVVEDCSKDKSNCPPAVPLLGEHTHRLVPRLDEAVNFHSGGSSDKHDREIEFALVGYADLAHPIDAISARIYRPYSIESPYNGLKFAIADIIVATDDCNKNVILDLATTTMGESGSILIYLPEAPLESLSVIGMHTCCSEFFSVEKGKPPQPELPCARVRRTFHNQALSIESVLNDPILGPIVKNHRPDSETKY